MRAAELIKQPYEKVRIGKILFCVIALCAGAYVLLSFWMNQRVTAVDVSGCDVQAAERMTWKIEKMTGKNDYMTIKGYAYEQGRSTDRADTVLLAYDAVSGTYYKLPTEIVKRTKLTEKANDGFNYDYAGFTSVFFLDKVPRGSELCIWYRGNGENILIETGTEISY